MKFSLISATSIFALFAAAAGSGHAAEVLSISSQTNLYDLVHDGMTSADGGDSTVPRQDPVVSAVAALETATVGWQALSFTGPVDQSIAVNVAFARVPLGAASGTRPDDDFATPITGSWQWSALQKAHEIGAARLASLIGTVGNGPVAGEKSGNTVFLAEGSRPGFGDGGNGDGVRSSSVAMAYAPSSTSTATITVAGAGNFRQQGDVGFSVAAANSLRAAPAPDQQPAPRGIVLTDTETVQPTLGYNYAPAMSGTKGNAVEASFSDAITASGAFAQINPLVTTARVQTSELQPGRGQPVQDPNRKIQTSERASRAGRPDQFQTSDIATTYSKLIDLAQPIAGRSSGTQVDGTQTFLSASVSVNPSTSAALYMANAVNAAPTIPSGQTVEAFQVGPTPGPRTQTGSGTSVADPIGGKIMASAGPLNNSLALP